jgi:proline utilization trans-activator
VRYNHLDTYLFPVRQICKNGSYKIVDYLGTSSNWSFTRRVLSMTYENVYQAPLPTEALLFDGTAYNLDCNDSENSLNTDTLIVPTLDYALYLINTVNFRCGQLFHLYDPDNFMPCMHAFYSDQTYPSTLWYIHFLLILALGKALVMPGNRRKLPHGIEFFSRAIELLPDVKVLCREPMESTEILCCLALFYQSLDYRHTAYNYVRLFA